MSSFKKLAMASAAAVLAITAANAADLPLAPAPIPVVQDFGGWYLRGDIGMTNQQTNSLTNVVAPGTSVGTKFLTFDSAPLYSLGGGYQFNNWLRVDVTANIAATPISTASKWRSSARSSCRTTTMPASRSGCSSPTPMSISAPGGA
jgi:opacity protein-like surface antigen